MHLRAPSAGTLQQECRCFLLARSSRPLANPSRNGQHTRYARRGAHTPCQASSSEEAGDSAPESSSSSQIPDSLPIAGVDSDWREFRARLVRSAAKAGEEAPDGEQPSTSGSSQLEGGCWAHSVPKPEKGCLLIAHPLMFTGTQQYFSQAVIFLFDHSEDGSAGLILNRPTQYRLGAIAGAEALCPEFGDNTLYLGGDVGKQTVHVLHTCAGLPGSLPVVSGIHIGGIDAAKAEVAAGRRRAQDFRWFTRYSGWAPGQLARECEAGVWFTAAAGAGVVVAGAAAAVQDAGGDAGGSSGSGSSGGAPDGKAMWHAVLELMGGEYAQLSQAMKETYRADIMEYRPEAEQATDKEGD